MSALPEDWLAAALQPPCAHGASLGSAVLRAKPEDFQVHEELGFAPSGAGQHWLMQVRKRSANTEWVARDLAGRAGVRPHDVGFAGLKDRHAVTTQWFTVPVSRLVAIHWQGVVGEGYEVLQAQLHDRKLRRGVLAANRFELLLTGIDPAIDRAAVDARVRVIATAGVPNYFGPQRFGRDAGNLAYALRSAAAAAEPRDERRDRRERGDRSFALSAARSLIFNRLLAERVRAGSWNQLLAGDIAGFDDGNTVFRVPALDAALLSRCEVGDLHPTGPLWGTGGLSNEGGIAALEAATAASCAPLDSWLLAEGLRAERRTLRMRVQNMQHEWQDAGSSLRLSFRLNAGCFATTVLRELFELRDAHATAEI